MTSVPGDDVPLLSGKTPAGAWWYSHLATTKLPTDDPQHSTARDDVMNSVGIKNRLATPIQKSVKMTAAQRVRKKVERANEMKSRIGSSEKRT